MTHRRALIVHTRMPAFDRDAGSQDIDHIIRFLLRRGWRVTFLAREDKSTAEQRHVDRLRAMGVETHAGFGALDRLLSSNDFDLALIAFWELAVEVLPQLRRRSPRTRIVINSIDLHFLRNARRQFGLDAPLDATYGSQAIKELNVYNAADAVLAVSDKERDLLGDFLGEGRVFTLPLAEDIPRSPFPLADRRGMYFVGNFRHIPNREAVEYLADEVLPLLDPALLAEHPLTVIGNWLDQIDLDVTPGPGIRLVGWVPSVQPYIERSRLAAVPLLHGAGVKLKVIQALMAGTPVVTTPVGAEGLDLVQGEHALVASDSTDLAAGISRLLTDDDLWHHLADAGAAHVAGRHSVELVERRFTEILEAVMDTRRRGGTELAGRSRSERDTEAVRQRVQLLGRPGDVVLVAAPRGEELPEVGSHPIWPFPQAADGGRADFEPVDGEAAINHLEMLRQRGARWFVLPRPAFRWRYRYPELFDRLEHTARRVYDDEHLTVFDLAGSRPDAPVLGTPPAARVLVLGTYAAHRTGPPPTLVTELGAGEALTVEQIWQPETDPPEPDERSGADYIVHVRDEAVLPSGFLDTLIATHAMLGVDRVQPTHTAGPSGGPPVTERHLGTFAREIDEVTALPVLSVRRGADRRGPATLTDDLTVGLRQPLAPADAGPGFVRRTWVLGPDRVPTVHERSEPSTTPRISVLIATYDRPDLLRECVASFAAQTVDPSDFEVVVVDDGSRDVDVDDALRAVAANLQLVTLRIDHAGRSAAKNHAVMLARAPLVLFFDDDDRAAPDYLERHLAAHERNPGDGVAILGHTDWAPELERSPLMHYITDVDRLMFSYGRLSDGQQLDWRGFWEGRISCKRALLIRHGLHDQRLAYSIDVEMGWRLSPAGLRVVYDSSARAASWRAASTSTHSVIARRRREEPMPSSRRCTSGARSPNGSGSETPPRCGRRAGPRNPASAIASRSSRHGRSCIPTRCPSSTRPTAARSGCSTRRVQRAPGRSRAR